MTPVAEDNSLEATLPVLSPASSYRMMYATFFGTHAIDGGRMESI